MAKQLFHLSETKDKDSAVVEFSVGALEVYHAGEFQEACDGLLASGRKYLILDLSRLQNLRSQFIGMVIKLSDDAGKGERHLAVVASRRVIRVLEMFADDVGLELKTSETTQSK